MRKWATVLTGLLLALTTHAVDEPDRLGTVIATVVDADSGRPIPARLTITDELGRLVDLYRASRADTAVRKGIFYRLDKAEQFGLPPGTYRVYATRGMEWSLGSSELRIQEGETVDLRLALRREVDTSGLIAADTHIHTVTFSGHGDATIHERMITLPGEGIELAVATDHNHHTDYRPYMKELGLAEAFTPVVGNEVTTKNGHFNAFPMNPEDPVPGGKKGKNPTFLKFPDWEHLWAATRAGGAKVVILNHPHTPSRQEGPLGVFGMNAVSGDREKGPEKFGVDAMELISTRGYDKEARRTKKPVDPMPRFVDWFALLNHGERITAVGSSDSHEVGPIVGQGRTYVRSTTDDPAHIDVDEICEAFLRGDTTISMGILADIRVAGNYGPGQVVPAGEGRVKAELRVAAASWIRPHTARVFLNGVLVQKIEVRAQKGRATNEFIPLALSVPKHDAHLVCVVQGDGVELPFWFSDFTLAATNPIYLDADGDGIYSSPRETARKQLAGLATRRVSELKRIIKNEDAVIGVQMLSLAHREWPPEQRAAIVSLAVELAESDALYRRYHDQAFGT